MLFEDKDAILYKKITSDKIAEFNMTAKSIAEELEYYVYKHYLDGELFYIGKGTGTRCLDFKGRSEAWENYVDGRYDRIIVFIERAFSCENEALNYESKAIITSDSKSLVNVTHNKHDIENNKKSYRKLKSINSKAKKNIFLSKLSETKLRKINDMQKMEMDIFLALLSKINKKSFDGEKLLIVTSNKEIRQLTGNNGLYSSRIKGYLKILTEKYSFIDRFEENGKEINVFFEKEFYELLVNDELGYFSINSNELLSMDLVYSRILYVKLSVVKMNSTLTLTKEDLLDLMNPPSSYNEYDFIRKVLLPAIEDNSNFFVNLKLSNLRGNELPEVCKFSFFKKRSTKMERELALATRENIFELIEEYR